MENSVEASEVLREQQRDATKSNQNKKLQKEPRELQQTYNPILKFSPTKISDKEAPSLANCIAYWGIHQKKKHISQKIPNFKFQAAFSSSGKKKVEKKNLNFRMSFSPKPMPGK